MKYFLAFVCLSVFLFGAPALAKDKKGSATKDSKKTDEIVIYEGEPDCEYEEILEFTATSERSIQDAKEKLQRKAKKRDADAIIKFNRYYSGFGCSPDKDCVVVKGVAVRCLVAAPEQAPQKSEEQQEPTDESKKEVESEGIE